MWARRLSVATFSLALAAAAALIGWSSIAAAVSHRENVRLRLSEVPPAERAIQVAYFVPSGQSDTRGRSVSAFFRKFAAVTGPVRQIAIWHDIAPGISLFRPADPARDVIVTRGRLPSGCRREPVPASEIESASPVGESRLPVRPRMRTVCESLALAATFAIGDLIPLGKETFARVVGHGALDGEAFPRGSEDLLVRGRGFGALLVQSLAEQLTLLAGGSAMSVVRTASLDPDAVRGSEIEALGGRLRRALGRLEHSGPLLQGKAPLAVLDGLAERQEVARKRLLLVAGQGAALIVAFAAFAASGRRPETRVLEQQFMTFGGTRAQLAIARATEALVPSLLGGLTAVGGLFVAREVVARGPGLRGEAVAIPPETLLAIVALTLSAALLLFLSMAPRRRARFRLGPLELAALTALAVIVWQTAATGALDPARIAASERGSPVLLLLPALAFLATGVLLLRVLPMALRLAERAARQAPAAARLAFVSAARSPEQAAAGTTFLAVALGAALFSLNYEATLDRQTRAEAAFTAGAAWRVIEGRAAREVLLSGEEPPAGAADVAPSTSSPGEAAVVADVTPLTRFARVSAEPPTPVLRLTGRITETAVSGRDLPVEILALPAARLPELVGWREDFATIGRSEIARRLRPRPVRLTGPRLADDAEALRFWVREVGQHRRTLTLHFLLPGQGFERVRLGFIGPEWKRMRLELPASLRGAQLVGVEFPTSSIATGAEPLDAFVDLGAFEQRRPSGWSPLPLRKWTTGEKMREGALKTAAFANAPVEEGLHLDFKDGIRSALLIRPALSLPQALPAVASARVAAAAVDDLVTLKVLGEDVPVRVVSTARLFPTIVERPSLFVVLDYDTLFAALNVDDPGEAVPSEAWFFQAQRPDFVERLRASPFRLDAAVGAEPLAARLLTDPLAAGTRNVLRFAAVAAAVLGLLGLVLATRAMLRSESLLFAEYEVLGVPPKTLARITQTRLLALSLLGLGAGVLGALLAGRLVGASVAVTGTAARPLPPIQTVTAWPAAATLLGSVILAALATAALLARRSLRDTTAKRLRA